MYVNNFEISEVSTDLRFYSEIFVFTFNNPYLLSLPVIVSSIKLLKSIVAVNQKLINIDLFKIFN